MTRDSGHFFGWMYKYCIFLTKEVVVIGALAKGKNGMWASTAN